MARNEEGREEVHIGHGPRVRVETAWAVAIAAIMGMAVVAGLVVFFTLGRGGGTPTPTPTPTPVPAVVQAPTVTPTATPEPIPTPTPTATPVPTPTATPTPTPTPVLKYRLFINGALVQPGQGIVHVANGVITLDKGPDYPSGTSVMLTANPSLPGSQVVWGGVDSQRNPSVSVVRMDTDRFVTVAILAPTPTPPPTPTRAAAATRPSQPAAAVTLEIASVGEEFRFDKSKLTAKAGATVVVYFKNNAKTPGLQHNWVLVKAGTKDAVAVAGTAAGPANDWIPRNDARVVVNTKLVDPGKTYGVAFNAPAPGTYQFVCTFPGHNITMFGEFVVIR
jgi:azurin